MCCLALAGCSNLNITNPFAPTDVSEVYYSQFPDVPIPADLSVVPKNSLVNITQDSTKLGLETHEGRVEVGSLSNAMIHNMAKQGWSLRGVVSGKRVMQVHEKDQRICVLYFYDQTVTTAMEVWVMLRLDNVSILPPPLVPMGSPGSTYPPINPTTPYTPTTPYSPAEGQVIESWGGSTQPLVQ